MICELPGNEHEVIKIVSKLAGQQNSSFPLVSSESISHDPDKGFATPSWMVKDLQVINQASREVVLAYADMESHGILFDGDSSSPSSTTHIEGRSPRQSSYIETPALLDIAGYPAIWR